MRPPRVQRLVEQLPDGPVVYVYAGSERSDALVVSGSGVECVRLPNLRAAEATTRAEQLHAALADAESDYADVAEAARESMRELLVWLWDTIAQPVVAALGYDAAHADPANHADPADLPRMWWCPVGVLSELPLHAAESGPHTLLDRAVHSYTATLRALGDAHSRPVPPSRAALVVGAHDLTGSGRLPAAEHEVHTIGRLLPHATVLDAPTAESVRTALLSHPVAHFACHGVADRSDPAAGLLLLADHATDPLTVAEISALRLDGRLAVLTACQTTVSAPTLADESVHLSAAFQLAGYRAVVGTLWSVSDEASARLAKDFYNTLTAEGTAELDTDRAARAVHAAVRRLRRHYRNAPKAWAGYVHVGC
jgi:CHAT domain-containing protein